MFLCRKRKSQRLEFKEMEVKKMDTIQYGPLGYFDLIPVEVIFKIFGVMSVEDLSLLIITSKAMRNLAELYRMTQESINRLSIPRESIDITHSQEYYVKHFRSLGLLMKRSTCLYSTRDRLKTCEIFLRRLDQIRLEVCSRHGKGAGLFCYGKFISTMLTGWDDHECQRAFRSIQVSSDLVKNMDITLKSSYGQFPRTEMNLRLFLRKVFLDQYEKQADRAFWLSLMLKPWPIVNQAKLLYLLYGPVCNEEVMWDVLSFNTPATLDQSTRYLHALAEAIRTMHTHNKQWSEDDVISIVDELTSTCMEWLAENLANLLLFCGTTITVKFMGSKAINGRMCELGNLVASFCVVITKFRYSTSWLVNVIQQVLAIIDSPKERVNFLNHISTTFKDVLAEVAEIRDDSQGESDFMLVLDAQVEFSKEILSLAFKNMIAQ
ncbi:PREDICTED: F-box only protein 47-like [Priapulus caudatus]|uniref:F-box only protein 47-like n=1 Tax=Priapulus caudatus TaxID=37621 RepID=A0ABM1EI15_PRICU|nr:PREDICTED: F-box only protein 47-like [Priapulus caudatus]